MIPRETARAGEVIAKEALWPPRCTLNFYGRNHRPIATYGQRYRRLDLSDTLMLDWPHKTRVVYFGVSSRSTRMAVWDEATVASMERRIRNDLGEDNYRVAIRRETTLGNACADEFVWRLAIRPD